LKDAANPRYQVEVGLVKLMEMRRLAPLGDLVERIAALESALRTGNPLPEKASPSTTRSGSSPASRTANSSRTEAAAPAESANSVDVVDANKSATAATSNESFCSQVKSRLEQKRRRLMIAALESSLRADLEGDEFVVEFTPDTKHYRDTLARGDNSKTLRETCAEVCGREIGIRFVIKSDDEASASEPVTSDAREAKQKAKRAAAADPNVQQVQRAFGAEIVDVKLQ
jgi:hypothetical protein